MCLGQVDRCELRTSPLSVPRGSCRTAGSPAAAGADSYPLVCATAAIKKLTSLSYVRRTLRKLEKASVRVRHTLRKLI